MTAWSYRLPTPAATQRAGALLGAQLRPPLVVALDGELGAGKTNLVRGIAAGLGIRVRDVTSPTYAVCMQHQSDQGPVAHLDLYRLSGADDLESVGWWEMLDSIVLVEWASRVPEAVTTADLAILLSVAGPRSRVIEVQPRTAAGEAVSAAWRAALGNQPGRGD